MFLKILFIVGLISLAFVGMAASLHFSKYKKRASGCCGGGHCSTDGSKPENHTCHARGLDLVERHASQKS